jgi:ion channel
MDASTMRRKFAAGLLTGLRVVWPILSALLGAIVTLGLVIGLLEGWSVPESIYFAFVSGLTIGYGDLAPKTVLARTLAILIGGCGVLLTALVAAVAVKAFSVVRMDGDE